MRNRREWRGLDSMEEDRDEGGRRWWKGRMGGMTTTKTSHQHKP